MTRLGGRLTAWWLRAEPHVMGRSAVANAVAWLTVAALVQLTTANDVSASLQLAGPGGLADTWSVGILLAAGLMVAVYAIRDPEAQRVVEVAVLALVVACCLTLTAAIEAVTGAVGLVAACLSMALTTACVGRGVLLVRQIVAARVLARRARYAAAEADREQQR